MLIQNLCALLNTNLNPEDISFIFPLGLSGDGIKNIYTTSSSNMYSDGIHIPQEEI